MFAVYNPTIINKTVGISTESVHFNEKGIGEISSEQIYKEVLTLHNFFAIKSLEENVDETSQGKNDSELQNAKNAIDENVEEESENVKDDTDENVEEESENVKDDTEKKKPKSRKAIKNNEEE